MIEAFGKLFASLFGGATMEAQHQPSMEEDMPLPPTGPKVDTTEGSNAEASKAAPLHAPVNAVVGSHIAAANALPAGATKVYPSKTLSSDVGSRQIPLSDAIAVLQAAQAAIPAAEAGTGFVVGWDAVSVFYQAPVLSPAQIQAASLQAQIAKLQAELAALQPAPAPSSGS